MRLFTAGTGAVALFWLVSALLLGGTGTVLAADWVQTRTVCTMEAALHVADEAVNRGNTGAQVAFDRALRRKDCHLEPTSAVYDIVEVIGEKRVVKDTRQEFYVVTFGSDGQFTAFAFPGDTTSLE